MRRELSRNRRQNCHKDGTAQQGPINRCEISCFLSEANAIIFYETNFPKQTSKIPRKNWTNLSRGSMWFEESTIWFGEKEENPIIYRWFSWKQCGSFFVQNLNSKQKLLNNVWNSPHRKSENNSESYCEDEFVNWKGEEIEIKIAL